jgi:hypothetical protein
MTLRLAGRNPSPARARRSVRTAIDASDRARGTRRRSVPDATSEIRINRTGPKRSAKRPANGPAVSAPIPNSAKTPPAAEGETPMSFVR